MPGILLIVACTAAPDTGDTVRPPEEAETALFTDIVVTPTEGMPAMLEVRFQTSEPVSAWVEHSGWQTPATPVGTTHALQVLGEPPGTLATLQLAAEVDGERAESLPFSAEVGALTDWPQPDLTVNGTLDGLLLVVYQRDTQAWVALLNEDGVPCWSLLVDDVDERVVVMAAPSLGGGILVDRYAGDHQSATGKIQRYGLDGTLLEEIAVDEGHHAFVERPDGGLAYLAVDIRKTEEWGDVVGDRVVEIDADGTHRTIFSTWDVLEVRQTSTWAQGFYPQGFDWTHGSGLSWDEAIDGYTVTLAGANHVHAFDRDGQTIASIPGAGPRPGDGDYQVTPEAARFVRPHGAHWSADGDLLLFSSADLTSRGSRYRLDPDTLTATETAQYGMDAGFHALSMGSLEELADGDLLMVWGSAGVVEIRSPTDDLHWQLMTPLGDWISHAEYLSSPYDRLHP